MAESYQDIMSRLNGGQQAEKPKAANDFATYVRTLLENPNPQGGMMGDAADYYADPFRKQNAINQAILDEELAKKKAEEEAAKAAVGGGGGMMSGGGDSAGDMGGRNYYQEIEDRFYQENLALGATPEAARTLAAQQAFEIQSANNAKINAGLTLFSNAMIPGMSQMNLSKYGQAFPDYLQGNFRTMIGDTSGYVNPNYQPKAAGIAAPVVSGGGGTTYTPASLQETLNATGGILTPEQAQAVVDYTSGGNSGGGGSVGYGGQDGMGGQTDSSLTGYTE